MQTATIQTATAQTAVRLTHYPTVIGTELRITGQKTLIDPCNGEAFATVATSSTADVDQAVKVAKVAQAQWAKQSVGDRGAVLLKVADALEAHAQELAELESQNTGKPMKLSVDG
ncbi:MAG: aldehyde dehydrogenase family protein, partial [Cyanobacteria bacterium J06555_13]